MAKTNQELTVEVVCAFLQAWGGEGKRPCTAEELPNLISTVYNSIQECGSNWGVNQ